MAKFTHITNSFRSGQLGEKLVGRTDIEEYRSGCLELKNMISSSIGGSFRRGGLSFFRKIEYTSAVSTGRVKMIPFVLDEESYIVTIRERSSTTPSVASAPLVFNLDGDEIGVNLFVFGDGWTDIDDVRWTQSGRILFFCSSKGDVKPSVLYITDAGDFIFTELDISASIFGPSPEGNLRRFHKTPFVPNFNSELFLDYERDGSEESDDLVQFTDGTDPVDMGFTSGDVGRAIRFLSGAEEAAGIISSVVDSSTVKITREIGARPASTVETSDWSLGAWGRRIGFPRTVTTFQNRIIWGGTKTYPLTLWSSAVGRPFLMMQEKLFQDAEDETTGFGYFGDIDDLQAFDFVISSTRSTSIVWLGSQRSFHVGTDTVEYALASDTGLFGAVSFPSLRPQTFHGGRNVQASQIGRYSIFIGEDGKTVRDFSYSDQNGSHMSRDLSVLSPDLLYSNLREGSFAGVSFTDMGWQESARALWLTSNRGALFSFSFEENSNLKAWAYHEIGGDFEIDSIAVVPFEGESTLFVSATKEIDGSLESFIFRMQKISQDPKYVGGSEVINYFDGGSSYKYETATDTHDADWLEGEEVFALADGNEIGPFTVDAGVFTTPEEVSEISFGFKYSHKLQVMPLEAGTIIGSAQGQLKRVDRIFLDLYRAVSGRMSYSETDHPIEYPSVPALESFTGRVIHDYESTPDERYTLTLEGDKPLPFGILNLTFRGVTQD